mgnify:CR=1 FL=1
MTQSYSVSLEKIITAHNLEIIYLPKPADEILITTNEVNRPGIVMTGYTDYFDADRVQILGWTEFGFLLNMEPEKRRRALQYWLALHPAAAVVTRGLDIPDYFVEECKAHQVPLLRTQEETSPFLATLIAYLNAELAPRITRHGVLVEVYGEGILLIGDSGIGKSEAAVELLKRGHRLIADDAVEIRKVSTNSLVGTAPKLIRNYIELRGIGIVNVAKLFGMGAVRTENEINLIVNIVPWNTQEVYDRLGLEEQYMELLGVKVPMNTIPITPGRNLAMILEVAAMNNRQKKLGYNAALEFTEQVNQHFDENMGRNT